MTQQIIKIGNSQGVILPKEVLEELGVKKGDLLDIEIDDSQATIRKKGYKKTKLKVSQDLLSWLDGFNARYKNALQELAGK